MSWKKIVVLIAGLAAVATLLPVTVSAATHSFTTTKIVMVYGKEKSDHTTAWCPHGWHVTGGGFDITNTASLVRYSRPILNAAKTQGWTAGAATPVSHQWVGIVYALCTN